MIAKTTFAPSKKPYALNLSSFSINADGKSTVDAIWVGRKDGGTYVCVGQIWGYRYVDLDDFMARFDARYGGSPTARWDGESLWGPGLPYAQSASTVALLDSVLSALPDVPAGYDGWYAINAKG